MSVVQYFRKKVTLVRNIILISSA